MCICTYFPPAYDVEPASFLRAWEPNPSDSAGHVFVCFTSHVVAISLTSWCPVLKGHLGFGRLACQMASSALLRRVLFIAVHPYAV